MIAETDVNLICYYAYVDFVLDSNAFVLGKSFIGMQFCIII